MRIRPLFVLVGILTLGASDATPPLAAVAPAACDALARLTLAGGTVLSAESIQAGAFAPPSPANAAAAAVF
jgi:hypothetical protein